MTYRTSVDSGELRIFVYGSLRAESRPVVREINALRRRCANDSTASCRTLNRSGDPVEVTVEPRAPVIRCYKCGSSHVSALCHHCWRPGCAKHVLPLSSGRRVVRPRGWWSGLQTVRACHCDDCAHVRVGTTRPTNRWPAVGLVGIGLAAIGLISIWLSPIVGLIFLLTGGIATVWAYRCVRRAAAQLRLRMPVPLHPVADVELIERLRGEITLRSDDFEYQTVLNRSRARSA
jgi:hypothetical protein